MNKIAIMIARKTIIVHECPVLRPATAEPAISSGLGAAFVESALDILKPQRMHLGSATYCE